MRGLVLAVLLMGALPLGLTAQDRINPKDMLIKQDEFKGYQVWLYKKESRLDGENFGSLALKPQKFVSADGDTTYQLFMVYRADDWIFINRHRPLELLADGQLIELESRVDRSTDVRSGGQIRETQMYNLSAEQLRTLAAATTVKVRVPGNDGSPEARFSQNNFKVLRGFVAAYVDGAP